MWKSPIFAVLCLVAATLFSPLGAEEETRSSRQLLARILESFPPYSPEEHARYEAQRAAKQRSPSDPELVVLPELTVVGRTAKALAPLAGLAEPHPYDSTPLRKKTLELQTRFHRLSDVLEKTDPEEAKAIRKMVDQVVAEQLHQDLAEMKFPGFWRMP